MALHGSELEYTFSTGFDVNGVEMEQLFKSTGLIKDEIISIYVIYDYLYSVSSSAFLST